MLVAVDAAGLRVVGFSMWGAVKMKLLCPLALAFFVLLCKASISVLDKLSQKIAFLF